MRVPYPLDFYTRNVDFRIDDPKAGWKGRGLWTGNEEKSDLASRRRKGQYDLHRAFPDPARPACQVYYQVIFSAYFDSPAALQTAMQSPRMGEVMGDIAKYYDGMPDVLIGEVVALPA
jgi:hypothetical protein